LKPSESTTAPGQEAEHGHRGCDQQGEPAAFGELLEHGDAQDQSRANLQRSQSGHRRPSEQDGQPVPGALRNVAVRDDDASRHITQTRVAFYWNLSLSGQVGPQSLNRASEMLHGGVQPAW
jgi:hypothetical protein